MKKFIRVLVPLLLAVLIIASIGWYLFTYDRGFTRDFLLTQARYNDLHGNSRLSSWFYDLAYNFSSWRTCIRPTTTTRKPSTP